MLLSDLLFIIILYLILSKNIPLKLNYIFFLFYLTLIKYNIYM